MKIGYVLAYASIAWGLAICVPAQAQTKLELAYHHNETDMFGDTMRWWVDEVKSRTEGRVEITPVYNGALFKVSEAPDAVRDGVAPMASTLASFMSGMVPALGYVEMIGGLPSDEKDAGKAMAEIWPDFTAALAPQGVVPLWGQTGFGIGVICRDKHLESGEDWAGQSIRTAGRWHSKQVEAMGASPVPIDSAEVYIALQNGNVNCALMNPTVTLSLRLYEVAPYYTNLDLPTNIEVIIVNKDVWESIPEADRAIVAEVSKEAMARGVTYIKGKMEGQFATIEQAGGKVHTVSPEERQRFLDASKPIFDEIGLASGELGQSIRQKLSTYW